jgi:hypothetical protein
MKGGVMSDTLEFHLREYSALREEILERTRQIEQSTRLMLIGLPALVSWIVLQGSHLSRIEATIAAWIPFLAAIFFVGHRRELLIGIKNIAIYIRRLEASFADPRFGWESRRPEKEIVKSVGTSRVAVRTLYLAMVFTFAFGVWRTSLAFKDVIGLPF